MQNMISLQKYLERCQLLKDKHWDLLDLTMKREMMNGGLWRIVTVIKDMYLKIIYVNRRWENSELAEEISIYMFTY